MPYTRPAIAAMTGYVPGEQPPPGKYIKLNTNENPYPPSPLVVRTIQEAAEHQLMRYPDPVATSFRIAAADILKVDPDCILCGNGSDDILTIVTRAHVGQGELLRLPYPSYVLYRTLAEIQGAEYQEVHFQSDWTLDASFTAPHPGLKLAYLPNPNSPSGSVLSPAQVLDLADRLPCPLLVDEAYADFAAANCVALVAENEKIMVSRTLSKSYGLAGLRFGFLVAQPQVIAELMKVKDSYNCDALAIAGATAALRDQNWLQQNRRAVLATRSRMQQRLQAIGFETIPSQANFLWCTQPGRPLQPLYDQLKVNHVLVRYMNYPGWGEGLHISVGTDEQIDACLQLLEAMV